MGQKCANPFLPAPWDISPHLSLAWDHHSWGGTSSIAGAEFCVAVVLAVPPEPFFTPQLLWSRSWQLPCAGLVPSGWAQHSPSPWARTWWSSRASAGPGQGRGSSCTIHPRTQNREQVQSVCNILLKKYECSVHKVQLNGLDKISRDLLVNIGLLFFFSL